ncbi:hypothetical protein [Romboutsia sp. 1001713B170207_170306_H8]|uniref:hypothetical protein n=1 Tax=Romboutsia sp. 1001713B170207_170306_H8 TaxID=2787112 RepID=UPI001897B610|nr:hypothetical protein [Romboutsia sp. 1001713B170207_170306_H8]
MKEKRNNMMKIMVTDTEKKNILDTIDSLKAKGNQEIITVSELIRQSLNEWISKYNRIEDGNVICYLPISEEIRKNKITLIEIEDLLYKNALQDQTKHILSSVIEVLERQELNQLNIKYSHK